MAKESTQHTLDRVRPPRVQITYDVEIAGAIEQKELPFQLGVVGDFSGAPKDPLPPMKERKFVNIDRDNFDDVLKGMKPRLQLSVPNKLTGEGKLGIEVNFDKMEDFEPEQVAKQIEPLNKLLILRRKLSDLRNKMHGNEKLEELLQDVVLSTEKLRELGEETGYGNSKEEQPADEGGPEG